MSFPTSQESKVLPSGLVTFVMTDIEGSTRLFRQLGDVYIEVLATHNRLLREAVARRGGVEVGTEGDSLLVAFEDAGQAVAACIEGQVALHDQRWPEGVELRVRMGVHSGEASPVSGDYVSLAIHQVARISSGAHGSQILISEATADLVRGNLPLGAELSLLGSFHLRGFASPERLYQLRHPDLRDDFPPLRAMGVIAHNLPFHRTSFVGRSEELSRLKALLEETGVVSIVGPGGVGKTRLAVQLAFDVMAEFTDGAWLVELAPVDSAMGVVRALASVMSVSEEPGGQLEEQLMMALKPKNSLLILDNCEHVLDPAARLAERLTRDCPDITVLATSREPLDIEGEVVWRVDPLQTGSGEQAGDGETSDAVRLFVERARLVQPRFELAEDNRSDVAQIVSHLNGIPLAIELAAAALSDKPLRGVVEGLGDRFALLTHGRRTAPNRHQTMRGAIEWSLDLLAPEERRLFERLAIFAGDWSTEAAIRVCGAAPVEPARVPDLLTHLARASLLTTDHDSPGRWSMLETVRELAFVELSERGEMGEMARRHRNWYSEWASSQVSQLGRRGQSRVIADLESDQDNIRRAIDSAIASSDAEIALSICAALTPYWTSHADWSEGVELCFKALTLSGGGDLLRARVLAGLGKLLLLTGELEEARSRFDEALSVAGDDDVVAARALAGLGLVDFRHSQLPEAEKRWRTALEHASEAGDQIVRAEVLRSLAIAAGTRGEQSRAGALLDEAIEAAQQAGDDQLLRLLLGSSAEMRIWLGEYDGAEAAYGEALALATEIGDFSARPLLLAELGWTALLRGDVFIAERLALEAAELAEELGHPRVLAHSLRLQGEALLRTGRMPEAKEVLEEAADVAATLDAPAEVAGVLCSQAYLALQQQEYEVAGSLATQASELSELSHSMRLTTPQWVLGTVALRQGDLDMAEESFRRDLEVAERMDVHRYKAMDHWGMAGLAAARGALAESIPRYRDSIELSYLIRDRLGLADGLVGLGTVAGPFHPGESLALVGAAGALRVEVGVEMTPLQESLVAEALEAIGRADPDVERRRDGGSVSLGEAVNLAAAVAAAMQVSGTGHGEGSGK